MVESTPGVYTSRETGETAVAAPVAMNVVGIVGTASKGLVDEAVLINSIQEAYEIYGYPDAFDADVEGQELSLTRALSLVYDGGAQGCWVVRVASSSAAIATRDIDSASGTAAVLEAGSEGTWGNDIRYKVEFADGVLTTDNHVESHGGFYEASYTDALTLGTPFSWLAVIHAPDFIAEMNAGNSIDITYSSGTGSNIVMNVIHSDAFVFNEGASPTDGDIVNIANSDKIAQTFFTRDACTIEGANFRMQYNAGAPDPLASNCKLEIFAVDSDHKPTGSALGSGTETFTNLALGATYSSESITLDTAVNLDANTEYVLVLSWDGTWTSGDFQLGGLEAPTATPIYTRGLAWFSADTGATWGASTTVETNLFYPDLTINENHCVFVINSWTQTWPSGNTGNKYVIWSTVSTPTDTTYANVNFYTATSMKVTVQYGGLEEKYWVLDGYDLIADVNENSSFITASVPLTSEQQDEPPSITSGGWQYFGLGGATMGANGATDIVASDFDNGFTALMTVDAHIIMAAGRSDNAVLSKLQSHVINASANKKERVAVAGHAVGLDFVDVLTSNGSFAHERLQWFSPGIKKTNPSTGTQETLPAAYTAGIAAGFLAANEPATSMLHKPVSAEALETYYTETQVEQIISKRMVPISELTEGGVVFRHHINTSTDAALSRTTIVRIADYADRSIRSVTNGFIGHKNLKSQRAAIKIVCEGVFEKMDNLDMLNDEASPYEVVVSMPDLFTVQVVCAYTPVGTIEIIRIKSVIRGAGAT